MTPPLDARLHVVSLGHFHPRGIIDNEFLESLDIGADAKWIAERVGIRSRRTVLPLDYIRTTKNCDLRAADEAAEFTNAETGAEAARMAMARVGLRPEDVGMIISGGCSPRYSTPAEACTIAAELGIECPAFDVSSACSTFVAQIHMLKNMRPEALPEYILLVTAENTTRKVDYGDRKTAVLWGDGSTAAIVSTRIPGRLSVIKTSLQSDPSGWDKVTIPTGGFFKQDGPAVQSFAIRKSVLVIDELCSRSDERIELAGFVGHQANLLMLKAVCRKAGIPERHHLFNVDRYGNCGASGALSVLSELWGDLPVGLICVALVGSGLTWGGMLFDAGPPPSP
ncbi:3-oxoacyl-[acyl-carrier-protein] synthase, KASIII [Acidisarcina polymorpha]|uniref:3-oxoacyl-[acyl-carrier-protein] synthase, KASIII n=2 Tax=Acidisarcina polymorpha TaxID=2211140 RepID=A0A2Z5FV33_9BACT|nr:3-oxoacyl-[acyl-carrier-protein] synthase, KASIII [Acidisarcina polymorpha]